MKLNPNEANVSEAVRKLNPHLFGVALISAAKSEREQERALVGETLPAKTGRARVGKGNGPIVRVQIILCGSGPARDSDNLAISYKQIRDAIAASLNLDDADSWIDWEYSQVRTRGQRGTILKLELIK